MSDRVIDRIDGIADQLREQAWEAERLGQLPDETVKMLKSAGNIRLLQPETHLDHQRERVGASGTAIKDDPYVMYGIGEAAADIYAARQELLANVDRIYDIVDSGREVSFENRAAGRRTQVRAVWRAVAAVDQIFARSGGNAMRMDKPLQRYWRDAHTGLAHAIHVPGTVYHASALSSLGVDPQGPLRAMI